MKGSINAEWAVRGVSSTVEFDLTAESKLDLLDAVSGLVAAGRG